MKVTSGSISTAIGVGTLVGALLVLLAFGAAPSTAKPAKNSVGSKQLKRAAVRAPKIAKNAVKAAKIANGAVRRAKIANGAVNAAKLADGAVGDAEIAAGAVGTVALTDLAVTAAKLASNSVNSAKVQDNSLTGADIDESTLSGLWFTGGNAGTNAATDFLGTTDNTALELRVNDARALRLEPAVTAAGDPAPNVIGGMTNNTVSPGAHSATIAGGGWLNANTPPNRVTAYGATVGGGLSNLAGSVDGGPTAGNGATVAGGYLNEATESSATVSGGGNNNAFGSSSTVGGGFINTASGLDSTVPGGRLNVADGQRSFAAGYRAKANHAGTFVWGDGAESDISSSGANQFIARASGGFFLQSDSSLDDQGGFLNTSTGAHLTNGGAWTNSSDVNRKQDFEQVEASEILAQVAALPISRWSYKAEPGVRHLGPTAQDFHAAFGLGSDERHIATVDAGGVALAAIKGLHAENQELRADNEQLETRLDGLESELAALRALIED